MAHYPSKTNRDLLWITKDERAIAVRDLENDHLLNLINFLNRKHIKIRLKTGCVNIEILTLWYLEDEAFDRGLKETPSKRINFPTLTITGVNGRQLDISELTKASRRQLINILESTMYNFRIKYGGPSTDELSLSYIRKMQYAKTGTV